MIRKSPPTTTESRPTAKSQPTTTTAKTQNNQSKNVTPTSQSESPKQATNDSPKQWVCDCGKSFTLKRNLTRHKSNTCGTQYKCRRLFPCPICQKKFQYSDTLKRHIAMHQGIYPYTCEVCGKGSTNPDTIKKCRSSHGNDAPTNNLKYFRCEPCDMTFHVEDDLRTHNELEHARDML